MYDVLSAENPFRWRPVTVAPGAVQQPGWYRSVNHADPSRQGAQAVPPPDAEAGGAQLEVVPAGLATLAERLQQMLDV
jgi:hypothetical protein